MEKKRTINDEINDMIESKLDEIPFPQQCTITKVYGDGHVDVATEDGSLSYQRCFGSATVGELGLLIFQENSDTDTIIITDSLTRLALNQPSSNKFNFAVITRTETALDESTITNEELWILSNAYYDYKAERFVKIDTTHTSFGIQIQANGSYPGEAQLGYADNVGINVWRNPKASDVIKDTTNYDYSDFDSKKHIGAKRLADSEWVEFAISSGWNNSFMIDSYGGMTLGGAGFEVDGNGVWPFTRLTSSAYIDSNDDRYYLLGLLDNAYHPTLEGWECDSNITYSWFIGLRFPESSYLVKDNKNAEFVVMYNDTAYDSSDIHNLDISKWHVVFSVGKNGINVGI